MPPKHRDLAPFLYHLRNFLLGRKHVTHHRYQDTVSPRNAPVPARDLIYGDRLSANPYYVRDARCLVKPPIDLIEEQQKKLKAKAAKIAAAEKKTAAKTETETTRKDKKQAKKELVTPGRLHNWD